MGTGIGTMLINFTRRGEPTTNRPHPLATRTRARYDRGALGQWGQLAGRRGNAMDDGAERRAPSDLIERIDVALANAAQLAELSQRQELRLAAAERRVALLELRSQLQVQPPEPKHHLVSLWRRAS